MLRRTEHLDGLLGPLDGHLVEQKGVGFGLQIWCNQRKKRGKSILVVGETIAEGCLDRATARTDQKVDVSNFVAVANQRLAHTGFGDLRHYVSPLNHICRIE